MTTNRIVLLIVCVLVIGFGAYWISNNNRARVTEPGAVPANPGTAEGVINESVVNTINTDNNIMNATIHTNKGDFGVEFIPEIAPKTVANFVKLAGEGFYNGTKFHRVIKGFMNQGGDPLSKDDSQAARWGTGGPGYNFEDEITSTNKNDVGTLAMANAGPDTNGSQFFINVSANNFLDTKHTVFGKIIEGLDVVMAINSVPTDQNDRPINPVIIESITLK